jgi:hypothetical protein
VSRRPIHTAYCRYDGDYPCSINGSSAVQGFNYLGLKIVPFYGFGDIETDVDCGPEALVYGYIGDVHLALKKLGLPMPKPLDYPEELRDFLGRDFKEGLLGDIRDRQIPEGIFVKPQEHKVFTGFVYRGVRPDRLRLATYPDETPVYYSDVVSFISEYRAFVLDGKILDVRRYNGDWSKAPSRDVVEAAVRAYTGSPRAYALDFGVTSEGQTLLVEANDGFALGSYGLPPEGYARMIEARWEEITESLV